MQRPERPDGRRCLTVSSKRQRMPRNISYPRNKSMIFGATWRLHIVYPRNLLYSLSLVIVDNIRLSRVDNNTFKFVAGRMDMHEPDYIDLYHLHYIVVAISWTSLIATMNPSSVIISVSHWNCSR